MGYAEIKQDLDREASREAKAGGACKGCPPPKKFLEECKKCSTRADANLAWADKMIAEYTKAGNDPSNVTGTDIENAVDASLTAQGIVTSVAGTTDASGNVKVKKQKGPCARLEEAATRAHEDVHANHTKDLQKKLGKNTPAFKKAWNDAKDWAGDEVNAYTAEKKYWEKFKDDCKKAGA